jgi:hypothetical protein
MACCRKKCPFGWIKTVLLKIAELTLNFKAVLTDLKFLVLFSIANHSQNMEV